MEATIEAFLAAFSMLGYEECSSGELEGGYEKVALYADDRGVPTHAARQLPNGRWTSKLGHAEDIVHSSLQEIGNGYGRAVAFLRRPASQ